ncbi:hypothetical protein D3C80_1350060 [compost metagenome]
MTCTSCRPISVRTWHMRPSSSTISMGVRRTLAKLCARLTDTGATMRWAPDSSASLAPRRFGANTVTCRPGYVRAWATTSRASAICGSKRAGTKEATSMWRTPAR